MPIDNINQLVAAQARQVPAKRTGVGSPDVVARQSLPGSGEVLPQAAAPVQPAELAQMVGRLNDYVQTLRRDLEFRVDEETNKVVVSVVDPGSGTVIRQIPSEEVLAVARSLGQFQGLIVDTKA